MLTFKYDGEEYDVKDMLSLLEPYEIDEFMKCLEFFEIFFEMNKTVMVKPKYNPGASFVPMKEPEPIKDGNWTIHFIN